MWIFLQKIMLMYAYICHGIRQFYCEKILRLINASPTQFDLLRWSDDDLRWFQRDLSAIFGKLMQIMRL